MRVIFFGTGAMACLFAARFVLAGVARVTLLGSWPEAIKAIRRDGIRLQDGRESRIAPADAAFLHEPAPLADLAIVLVKSWQTPDIAVRVGEYLRSGGLAVSLQNGLGNTEILGDRVCPGVTSEGATLLAPGQVAHCGSGETRVAAPEWVAELLRQAGFNAASCAPEEAESLIWGKLAVSCGINALTALCGVRNGELLERRTTAALLNKAARECGAVARARGIALPFADPAIRARAVARQTAGNLSSMLQDVRRGAPTECDAINGAVAREGRRLGVPVPVNEALWRAVRWLAAKSAPAGGNHSPR